MKITKIYLLIFLLISIVFAGYTKDSYVSPYTGEIIKDEKGASFQASRIVIGVKHNVTREQVQQLAQEVNGKISAELKSTGWCRINVSSDQRENLSVTLKNEPEILTIRDILVDNHTQYEEGKNFSSTLNEKGEKILSTAISIEIQSVYPSERIQNLIKQYTGSIKECLHPDVDIYSIDLLPQLRDIELTNLKIKSEVFYAIRNYYGNFQAKKIFYLSPYDNDSFYTNYYGAVIPDDPPYGIYQANTVLLSLKENITRDQVEEMIKPYDGYIVGQSAPLDYYTISLPADQREIAIMKLIQRNEVSGASRNYYDSINSVNTPLDIEGILGLVLLVLFSIALYFLIRKYIIK